MSKTEKKKEGAEKAEVPADEAAKASSKKRLLILAIGGILALAGIGGGITFFLASGGSGDHAAQAAPASDEKGAGEHKEAGAAEHKEAGHDEKKEAAKDEKKDGGKSEKKEAPKEEKKEGAKDEKKEAPKEEKKEGAKDEKKEGGQGQGAASTKKPDANDPTVKIEGIDFGCTHTFPMFNLNLGNPLENRYMRMEVAVEYGCGQEAKAELDRRAPQLRDAIASVARRKTREFMLGPDGLDQLRKEIHIKLNALLTHKVDKIFITDILIE